MTDRRTFRARMRAVAWLLGSVGWSMLGTALAHACACDPISPTQGFARAQYVFTGRVVETIGHTWTVDVGRVWKGADKLAARVRLLDVYSGIDCAFYFDSERTYLFFAIVAKGSRYVYYQPQVCNWTAALQSKRVVDPDGSMWLEDFIVKNYGSGERPRGEDPWEHPFPAKTDAQK